MLLLHGHELQSSWDIKDNGIGLGAQREDCIWKLQNSFWNQHLHGLDCLNNMNTESSVREITTDPMKKAFKIVKFIYI